MTKAPKKPDSRAKALAAMTKPELVKTIKALDRKQTALLNRATKAEQERDALLFRFNAACSVYLRDVDGTGSLHSCAKDDVGAIAYVPASLLPEDVLQDYVGFPVDGPNSPDRFTTHGSITDRLPNAVTRQAMEELDAEIALRASLGVYETSAMDILDGVSDGLPVRTEVPAFPWSKSDGE